MVKNLPANAGDTDSIPSLGRAHMPRITKPVTTSAEPECLEAVLHSERSRCREGPTHN